MSLNCCAWIGLQTGQEGSVLNREDFARFQSAVCESGIRSPQGGHRGAVFAGNGIECFTAAYAVPYNVA